MVTALLWPMGLAAQLTVVEGVPLAVVGGRSNAVSLVFHNAGANVYEGSVQYQLSQVSSATTADLGRRVDWKRLQVLPDQTVLESALIPIPTVKAETPFVITWLDATGKKLGQTDVTAYPTNLLNLLTNLSGAKRIGIFDPAKQIRPTLERMALPFEDLEASGFAGFEGQLAIVASSQVAEDGENVPARVQTLAQSGVAVVWIQEAVRSYLEPPLSAVPCGKGAIANLPWRAVTNLVESPRAQLNLLQAAQMSLSAARGLLDSEKP